MWLGMRKQCLCAAHKNKIWQLFLEFEFLLSKHIASINEIFANTPKNLEYNTIYRTCTEDEIIEVM